MARKKRQNKSRRRQKKYIKRGGLMFDEVHFTDYETELRDELIIEDLNKFEETVSGPYIVDQLKSQITGILYLYMTQGGNFIEDLKDNKSLNRSINLIESYKARAKHTTLKGNRGHHSATFKRAKNTYKELEKSGVYQLIDYLNELLGKKSVKLTKHLTDLVLDR